VHLRQHFADRRGAAARLFEHPSLASRQAVAIGRELLKMPRHGAAQERQRRGVRLQQRFERAGIRRSIRGPCLRGERDLRGRDRAPRREQRLDLVRGQLAKALEARMAGVTVDANQRDRLRARAAADVVEELNEIELIEQIVLEPQHELVVIVFVVDRAAPLREIGRHVDDVIPIGGEELRPHAQQLLV
jgi:hypothetical protein